MVILGGGSGSRLGASVNKVYLPMGDRPVLGWSVAAAAASLRIERIVIVCRAGDEADATDVANRFGAGKVDAVVTGGATRQLSELAGLRALAPRIRAGEVGIVAVHDGARPYASTGLMERVIAAAVEVGGAVAGLAPEEPRYRLTDGLLEAMGWRSLRRMQTPQAFVADALLGAYEAAVDDEREGVDTADVVARHTDVEIVVVEGEPDNLKLTFAEDLVTADEIRRRR
jgi:2-C-methyl-D-erythritol 4-phosphate cytidylyltransferase